MKQATVFPISEEDIKAIRRQPNRALDLPVLSHQKRGVRGLGLLLLLFLFLGVVDAYYGAAEWYHYALLLPASLGSNQAWNLFAIVEDGVLCGGRFVPWKRIQSYRFEELHMNHPAYYSPEVGCAYELKIKTKLSAVTCIVTSEAAKEKVAGLLDAHVSCDKKVMTDI